MSKKTTKLSGTNIMKAPTWRQRTRGCAIVLPVYEHRYTKWIKYECVLTCSSGNSHYFALSEFYFVMCCGCKVSMCVQTI